LIITRRRFALFTIPLLIVVAGVSVASMIQGALAYHHRYLIDDPTYNNGGATSPWTWAFRQGVAGDGQIAPSAVTLKWCNNLGGYSTEVSSAFTNWETAVTNWTQFTQNCSSPDTSVAYESSSGANCPGTGVIGCWAASWYWDSPRSANYFSGGTVYLDPATTWSSNLVTGTVGHELGHALGLSEGYVEATFACYSGPSTIMDSPGCDSLVPTSNDTTDVSTFHAQTAPSGQSSSDCTWYTGYRSMCVSWYDAEPTNAYTYYDAWKCNNYPTCSSYTYLGGYWHQPGAGYYLTGNSAYTNSLGSSGYYYATMYHANAANGLGSGVATSPVWIP
jgi:hypothetical protein